MMIKRWGILALSSTILAIGSGCATKTFPDIHKLDATKIRAMSCEELEQEFILLNRHEDAVNKEASSGQLKQMLWGGIWSVMADEKLEDISRKQVRDRERLLYEAKLKKKCP